MNRWDIINEFLKRRTGLTRSYLEVGYYKGWSFDNVTEAQLKVAVDPNPCKTPEQESELIGSHFSADDNPDCISVLYKMTSDNFFGIIHETSTFDVIFIDGLHEANQVKADIHNALDHLKPGGVIILHDCNPPLYQHTTTGIDGCWTGDTYKAFVEFRMKFPEYVSYTIDTDWGCGVIHNLINKENFTINAPDWEVEDTLKWENFDKDRKYLLGLISVEEFKTKLNEGTKNNNLPA